MSRSYNKVKYYYVYGMWTKGMVRNVVGRLITKDEYALITGEDYE